ncbi:MAG: InlB B-repeat-containing protein, partial [Candidatus Methanomethylophilaceae archaeon]|nr:InlB B-repeat-containing protein [Candidatus Methanomethylophilaceae archaeon]
MSNITKPLPLLSLLLAAAVIVMMASPLSAVEDQGSREIYSYTANFSIEDGSNIQSVHWDFGFNDNDGNPVTSDEWEPRNITFPAKGTYIVTMTLTNSIGSTVKRLAVVIMGDPEVTFETNGGSYIEMLTVTKNTTIQEPVCTKEGFDLIGWFTTEDFEEGTEWDFENDLVTEHMTLYAKWSESQVIPGPSDPDEPTDPDEPGNPDTPGPGDDPLDPDDPGNPDTPGEPDTPL